MRSRALLELGVSSMLETPPETVRQCTHATTGLGHLTCSFLVVGPAVSALLGVHGPGGSALRASS